MKRAFLTAILMAAALAGASPQESGKAVPVPGPAPTSDLVWVSQHGANVVNIRSRGSITAPSVLMRQLSGATYSFVQPWDIVYLASRGLVFVTNAGNGTVTVVDAETLAATIVDLSVVPLNGRNLGGMSVSAGETEVFVAGADLAGAAIFKITVPGLVPSRIGGKGGPPADDCAAVRAGASGGSGNATRKVYFSQRLTNELSEINLAAGGAVSTVTLGGGALNEVSLPDNMDRTADHRVVFVGCTKISGGGNLFARVVRVDPSIEPIASAVTQPIIMSAIQDLPHRPLDVSWGTGPGGINRGFVLLSLDNGTPGLVEIDETGARVGGGVPPSGGTGGVTPSTIRFMSSTEDIFVGEVPGTSNQYNAYNAKFGSPITLVRTEISGNSEPGHFALVPATQPVLTDMCPRAALAGAAAGTNIVTLYGAGFQNGATFDSGAGPQAVTFIDSNTVTVDLSGGGATVLGGAITNPNGLAASIAPFYHRYSPESLLLGYPLTIPPATGGYQMYSVPEYLSLTAFKAALAAQLGPYNPVMYRVFFFRNGRYVELNTMKDDGCDIAGEAFWMISRFGANLTFDGPNVNQHALNLGASRVIPLNPGFNMVSVPMENGGASSGAFWANILVTDDQTDFAGTALSTTTPFGQSLVGTAALEFVNGSYAIADPLITGRGYWVENITTKPAYLVFSTTAIFKAGAPSMAAGSPPPPGMNPPPPPSGISESSGSCGFVGLEALLALAAVRAFHRSRRHRKLIA